MKYKLVGLYQLITGIFGILLLILSASKYIAVKQTYFLPSFILGLILYGLLAFAGYALFNQWKYAIKYSIWAQVLQIVSFTYKGVQYLFSGSAFIALVINQGIHIHTQLVPIAYKIEKVPEILSSEMKIYIMPIIIILLLIKK